MQLINYIGESYNTVTIYDGLTMQLLHKSQVYKDMVS